MPKESTPVGAITVSRVMINYPEVPLDEPEVGEAGWVGDSGTATYDSGNVIVTAADGNLYYVFNGPKNLMGSTFTFTLQVDQAFIDSGANLQPFYQNQVDYGGDWGWISNDSLTLSDITHQFTIPVDDENYNLTEEGQGARVGVSPNGSSPAGQIIIKKIEIIYGD